jgi:phage-related protein
MDLIFTVDYWVKNDGTAPALEALDEFEQVSPKLRDAVLAGIEKLGNRAYHTGNLIKQAEPGLWYLRVRRNRVCARLFFTFTKDRKIYLLNGFVKKSDRIPPQELMRARTILKEVQYA